jgi:hypothetical protein
MELKNYRGGWAGKNDQDVTGTGLLELPEDLYLHRPPKVLLSWGPED